MYGATTHHNMKVADDEPSTSDIDTIMMISRTMRVGVAAATSMEMDMDMGDTSGCKVSMLLNWNTINTCFLTSTFQVHSSGTFFAACLSAFLLVISLEFLRRCQRGFDRYLISRNAFMLRKEEGYVVSDEAEEKLLPKSSGGRLKGKEIVVALQQFARGTIHMVQFAVSYSVMLLVMYCNGYIIISVLLGALVGFALCTRDTLYPRSQDDKRDAEKGAVCC